MLRMCLIGSAAAMLITTGCVAAQPNVATMQPANLTSGLTTMNMNMQYRETVQPGTDVNQARAKIFADATKDCEVIAKAVGRKCVINNINFNNGFFNNNQTQNAQISANVNAMLVNEMGAQ